MKSKSWLFILIPILAIIIYVSLPGNEKTKASSIAIDSSKWVQWKNDKNETLKTGEESPIEDKKNFTGLTYYPYNPFLVLEMQMLKSEKSKLIKIKMNDGTEEDLILFGQVKGKFENSEISLIVYQHENGDLFIPFKDKTAPTETYGGGRYLDIPISSLHDSGILIDFNFAYNPFCAYNPNYACPVPPKENQLQVRIDAGEKFIPHE